MGLVQIVLPLKQQSLRRWQADHAQSAILHKNDMRHRSRRGLWAWRRRHGNQMVSRFPRSASLIDSAMARSDENKIGGDFEIAVLWRDFCHSSCHQTRIIFLLAFLYPRCGAFQRSGSGRVEFGSELLKHLSTWLSSNLLSQLLPG